MSDATARNAAGRPTTWGEVKWCDGEGGRVWWIRRHQKQSKRNELECKAPWAEGVVCRWYGGMNG
eukprot:13277594-Alexandrium_andersonii.AAC.1